MPRASWDFIGNLPQPVPPTSEQKRIVNFLDAKLGRLDELMRKKERQLALLGEITSACTGWRPNAANYYTASRILGPWTAHPNPCLGTNDQTTFGGQSSFVVPLPGRPEAFIFMADRWIPYNLASSRYLWLPIQFKGSEIEIAWRDEWNLGLFDKTPAPPPQ